MRNRHWAGSTAVGVGVDVVLWLLVSAGAAVAGIRSREDEAPELALR